MKAIYETKGRAREFCELAVNLYRGCTHGCVYCYAPIVLHQKAPAFHSAAWAVPRRTVLWDMQSDAIDLERKGESRPVLMCFTSDAYQEFAPGADITREAIQTLHRHGLAVSILTKGGERSERDFDLLGPCDLYGATLTLIDAEASLRWEPGAELPLSRIVALGLAHDAGIQTWVSMEPVLDPEQTLELIKLTHTFVDHYKIGTLNYHPLARTIDWRDFGQKAVALLQELGCSYMIKQDLARKME